VELLSVPRRQALLGERAVVGQRRVRLAADLVRLVRAAVADVLELRHRVGHGVEVGRRMRLGAVALRVAGRQARGVAGGRRGGRRLAGGQHGQQQRRHRDAQRHRH